MAVEIYKSFPIVEIFASSGASNNAIIWGNIIGTLSNQTDLQLELDGKASATPQFLTLATDSGISNERVFTPSSDFTVSDGGAGGAYSFALATQGGLSPGTYNTFTVNSKGVITAAANVGGFSLDQHEIFVGNSSNVATSVPMSGEATIIDTGAVTLDNDAVIGKVLTGFSSGAGTVVGTDTILEAIQKLDGNIVSAVLSDGNGTTANGTAVDLGGNLSSNVTVDADGHNITFTAPISGNFNIGSGFNIFSNIHLLADNLINLNSGTDININAATTFTLNIGGSVGTSGQVLTSNGTNATWATPSGGIGGSTGSVDNAILRADGTGGSTVQSSGLLIDDSSNLTLGDSSLAGVSRQLISGGSAPDIDFIYGSKGNGDIITLVGSGVNTPRFIIRDDGSTSIWIFDTSSATLSGGLAVGGHAIYTAYDGVSGREDGGNMTIRGGDAYVTGDNDGGHLFLRGGYKENGGLDANIALGVDSVADWQDMERGLFVGNATAEPAAAIASGSTLWSYNSIVKTWNDIAVIDDAKGVILKDSAGHYWRISVAPTTGVLSTTDLGTSI